MHENNLDIPDRKEKRVSLPVILKHYFKTKVDAVKDNSSMKPDYKFEKELAWNELSSPKIHI